MEGPRIPGYYASVTGIRPVKDGPDGHSGPVALYGQVHRYGRRQARRTYLIRALLGLGLPDIERVWKGPEIGVPALNEFGGVGEHLRVSGICLRGAEDRASHLNRLDPRAEGLDRSA